jgi:hypothetical protein
MRHRATHPFGILPFPAGSGACGSLTRSTDAKMRLYLASWNDFITGPLVLSIQLYPGRKCPSFGRKKMGANFFEFGTLQIHAHAL